MMKRMIRGLGWLSILIAGVCWSADVSLEVKASRSQIYLGESFNLTVSVNGTDQEASAPDLSALKGAKIRSLGSHSNSRSSVMIINGRMTREEFHGRIFVYEIQPGKTGIFQTGPVLLRLQGREYSASARPVTVVGIQKQDRVVAAVKASSTSVLVEEPFTITLSVAVRELPDPYAEENEPLHPQRPPHLSAGFLDGLPPNSGLKEPDLNRILSQAVDRSRRSPAFSINNYKSRGMDFGGFDSFFGGGDPFEPKPIRFRLPPKRIEKNGKRYREYTLKLDYTPTKEGEFTFGPLTFKGPVIGDVRDGRAELSEIYTIGPAVTVRVVPPPDKGRPDSFIGSVGKGMKATASLDTQRCKVGDPLTLTLEVRGGVSIANMRTPLLSLQPELTRDFRIYDDSPSSDTLTDGKRFKYRVRPLREGTLEFPPIALSFYDTEKKGYRTIHTEPLPLQVKATTLIAAAEGEDELSTGEFQAESRPSLCGITLTGGGAKGDSLLPDRRAMVLLIAAAPLLCLLALLFTPVLGLFRKAGAFTRHSGALARGLHALRQAPSASAVQQALRGYLSRRLDLDGDSLTAGEIARLLRERGVAETAVSALCQEIGRLDELIYRPDSEASQLAGIKGNLEGALARIDSALGKKRCSREAGRGVFGLLAAALLLSETLWADPASTSADRFIWEQANAQAASASKPEAYIESAKSYNRLVANGVKNGPLFLNLGSVLVMGGDGVNAIAAFNRAERYMGATPESRQGLALALALKSGESHVALPWSRTAFFWHYLFPCQVRVLAMLCGWTLLWLGLFFLILLKRKRGMIRRSLAETCLVTGALVFLVFGASVAVTWTQERHDAATWTERHFQAAAELPGGR